MLNNSFLNDSLTQSPPNRTFAFISGIIMLITSTTGIIGHFAIIAAIVKEKSLHKHIINIFICSLSFNDLTNLLLIQSLVLASYLLYSWPFGNVLCFLVPEINMILVSISLVHHVFIGIHRYLVVVKNSFYLKLHKTCYAISVITGSRLYPILLSLLLMCFLTKKSIDLNDIVIYDPRLLRCVYRPGGLRISIIFILTILGPCIVVSMCFVLILIFVRRMSYRSTIRDKNLLKRELRITKMFAMVFIMFILGYIPYGIVRAIDSKKNASADVYVVITVLYALASCLNPLIFGIMNESLRKSIANLFMT